MDGDDVSLQLASNIQSLLVGEYHLYKSLVMETIEPSSVLEENEAIVDRDFETEFEKKIKTLFQSFICASNRLWFAGRELHQKETAGLCQNIAWVSPSNPVVAA